MAVVEFKRILVPTDFSEYSTRAMEHALALARWYKGSVTAIHAYWAQELAAVEFPGPVPTRPDVAPLKTGLEKFLEPARAAGIPADAVMLEGNPVKVILEEAARRQTDLIVVGTHGRSGFERLVLGSVTEKVLRKSACPVLTVPRPAEGVPEEQGLFKSIVCPIDFSKPSERALVYALSLAQEAQGRLALLHVLEWVTDDPSFTAPHFNVTEYHRHLVADATERLARIVPAEARVWAELKERVVLGRPWQKILEAAREHEAGLIVMGCAGRNAVDLALFGSTTHHVVREATCPVLTIRA